MQAPREQPGESGRSTVGEPVAWTVRVAWMALAAWIAGAALGGLIDGDIWFHLAGGRWMLAHVQVPHSDEFSFASAGRPYVCLHWLFQLGVYACYCLMGDAGLMLLKAVLIVAGLALAFKACGLRGTDGSLLLLLLVFLGSTATLSLRPLLVSLVYLAVLLWVWRADRHPWLFPVTLLLWVNTHGLFVLGLLVAAAWMVEAPWRRWRWALLSAGACFLNPYGVKGVLFPLLLYTRIGERNVYSENIIEFASPLRHGLFLTQPAGWACLILFGCGVGALAVHGWRGPRQRVPALTLLFAGFAFLYLLALRNMAPFAVVAAWVVAELLPGLRAWQFGSPSRRMGVVLGVAAVALSAHLTGSLAGHPQALRQHGVDRGWGRAAAYATPAAAVAYLREHGWKGRLFNDFNWGGYLIFQLGPETPVFMDQRLEVHAQEEFSRYVDLTRDPRRFAALDQEYDFDLALFSHVPFTGLPALFKLLHENRTWCLVYADARAVIFCKDRPANAALLADRRLPAAPPPEKAPSWRQRYLEASAVAAPWWRAPDLVGVYREVGLGMLAVHNGQPLEGLARLVEAAELTPGIGDVHFLIACAALEAGDQELFRCAAERLQIVQPRHPELADLLRLAETMAKQAAPAPR
ncbi:MAG: hypothetical protein A3K19_18680 [Lentisphaerae bacterium RIFOXYB12_FULL_65_16]|nr:MAG: hypothetical protein A3K19_18680 [Lentisphaerae bacterium RIFOXYB12_FULL_65_16]